MGKVVSGCNGVFLPNNVFGSFLLWAWACSAVLECLRLDQKILPVFYCYNF